MSTTHAQIQPEIARLLEVCQGRGAVVVVAPVSQADAHHFYTGVQTAPTSSLLHALLITLGGTNRLTGARRYAEIVVVNAGRPLNERREEISLREHSGEEPTRRGALWETWWFRRPSTEAQNTSATGTAAGDRPSPRGRRGDYGVRGPTGRSSERFAVELKYEVGADYPNRIKALRMIVDELSRRMNPTLLLVNIAALDYDRPLAEEKILAHRDLSDRAFEEVEWFSKLGELGRTSTKLDVVLYSSNRDRVYALLTAGVPLSMPLPQEESAGRAPPPWAACKLRSKDVTRIDYPSGCYPWGDVFATERGPVKLAAADEDADDPGQRTTLLHLLRGESHMGERVRIKAGQMQPTIPQQSRTRDEIDSSFWANIDLDAIRAGLRRRYFGADNEPAAIGLLKHLEFRQRVCRDAISTVRLDSLQKESWRIGSSLMLWGTGGAGKSHLAKAISELLFGCLPFPIMCTDLDLTQVTSNIFGAAPGYKGCDKPTKFCQQVLDTHGLMVVLIDEVARMRASNFDEKLSVFMSLVHERAYTAANAAVLGIDTLPLWNTIFVVTANLNQWVPADVQPESVTAFRRRFTDHQFKPMEESQRRAFIEWRLCRTVEEILKDVTTCTTAPLGVAIAKVHWPASDKSQLDVFLSDTVRAALEQNLRRRDLVFETVPGSIDATDVFNDVLAELARG